MTSWWKKTLLTAMSVSGFVSGTYSLLTRRSVPRKNGTVHLSGLHEAVEIITDHYGIPHIYANNEDDLYFALGYVHAQDRLWQMELNRRIVAGRLSEIFGPIVLDLTASVAVWVCIAWQPSMQKNFQSMTNVFSKLMPTALICLSSAIHTRCLPNLPYCTSRPKLGNLFIQSCGGNYRDGV